MIVLFTDFGLNGPYTGQMKAVLSRDAPGVDVIDLFADAPMRNPRAGAYLLAAYAGEFPSGVVFLCVVDPGVGGERLPAIVQAGGHWFVGPENGLFELVIRRSRQPARWWEITWRPERLSASFHGRDLFAPVAARLARGGVADGRECPIAKIRRPDWPDDLRQVVYVDVFGNAITGMRAGALSRDAEILVGGRRLAFAKSFTHRAPGEAFWYENANGLVEIAVNLGSAAEVLRLGIGSPVEVLAQRAE